MVGTHRSQVGYKDGADIAAGQKRPQQIIGGVPLRELTDINFDGLDHLLLALIGEGDVGAHEIGRLEPRNGCPKIVDQPAGDGHARVLHENDHVCFVVITLRSK